jgi:hypothetical protein
MNKRMDAVGIEPTTFHMQLYMQSECYAPKLSALLIQIVRALSVIILKHIQILGGCEIFLDLSARSETNDR